MTDPANSGQPDPLAAFVAAIEQLTGALTSLQAELRAQRMEREAAERRRRHQPPGRMPPSGGPVVPWQPQRR